MMFQLLMALAGAATPDDPPSVPVDTGAEAPVAVPAWPQRFAGQAQPDGPHYDLELLYAEQRFEEGYAEAKRRLDADPSDTDLYWHVVRFMFEQGEKFKPGEAESVKLAHYEAMVEVAEAGLARAPTDPHLLFALGLAKGRLGTTRGVLSSLFMAKDIEQAWLKSSASGFTYASLNGAEQLPCDTYLALAIYYRLVPEYWVVQLIAGTRGDRQKAVDYAVKANTCAPDRIRVLIEVGASHLCKGGESDDAAMVERGLAALRRIDSITPVIPTDFIDRRQARTLIADPSLACEYSRDGQQDLDESNLKQP
jgi:hypothetical protein